MVDKMRPVGASYEVQRRVAGSNDIRLDGMGDLLMRCKGASVFDIGCNRGMVGYEFAHHGATKVHGCDIYEKGIEVAREVFADLRWVESRFEVVDLTRGPRSLGAFGDTFGGSVGYDFVVCLATYHKIKRLMGPQDLSSLVAHFGCMTRKYFAWRGTSDKPLENEEEIAALDRDLGHSGLARVHTSYLSSELGVAAVWSRP